MMEVFMKEKKLTKLYLMEQIAHGCLMREIKARILPTSWMGITPLLKG
jgi:hypothetical protein